MTRKEFIKICGILGLGLPPFSSMACTKEDLSASGFKGKVIIIGAGPGGLSTGYLLQQQGIEFEILEASDTYGGRMKIDSNFADFPIPLGAEWLETETDIFKEMINDPMVEAKVETIADDPDRKFVGYSWYNFFEEYIVPSISEKIAYNKVVQSIDYSGGQVLVETQNGKRSADKVVIAVPLKMLQDNTILFNPALPTYKLEAIRDTIIWSGFKAFFEFYSPFYDNEYSFNITPATEGEKIYYNASFGQNTSKNILGLFVVGRPAQDYTSRSGNNLKSFILEELDRIYSNQASPNYLNHISQNWDDEPFIQSGYMSDHADWRTVRDLGKSVADKIYFAGGAYTDGEDWVSVHAAARSAKNTIKELIK
ncbi:MAG TPA: FAD-dependent oxidoreductase [Saprospiraceae bacterium]|nr:FAD-dependent oxidoreductase [Saprospiraceae bacterium]